MSVTPKDTMWVGDRLLRPEEPLPENDPLVAERPELFVFGPPATGPESEPLRRGPGRPPGSKNKPKSASDD